ncbi:hypothetical protein [Sphingomonas psychrotolerans]|uniref:Uncharacterized protein n=1 Tax=Sphingomonas psychrotolerans TaxID=1327635 RepID=A0A2K8MNT7_9SPHN|nr:hypothetical protein [Sphingomonas psychrotolerans]ATY33639.1 hypothetical protein CVN68_18090 [Sphingomonas psychrotolerans]
MPRGLILSACFVALAFPGVASAQSGAMWTDDLGRMMSLDFAGGTATPPAPVAIEPAAMTDLFKNVCVLGDARAVGVSKAAVAQSLTPVQFAMGGKNPPAIGLWRGEGVIISQADVFLGNKSPQCNATFYVAGLPAKDAVVSAMTAALGAPPANAAEAVGKNGKPAKWWTPEWSVTATDGTPLIAVAHITRGGRDMPGDRIQLSLRVASKKGR